MKQQLIKEANEEFAKEFLKRLILVKLKQHYRNQDYSNSELEEEKFEKALKQMEGKSKEQIMFNAFLIYKDNKIYTIEQVKDQYYLVRFNEKLELDARSSNP
ncbi:MAG: hypothetical protein QXO70_03350, partial [Candidatus Pacearchaeota archaeon]